MPEKQMLVCGLPGSGKTTFLGALAAILEGAEVETALKYDGMPENKIYLNQLADRWLDCEEMDRTLLDSTNTIELKLTDGNDKILLMIPDFSGETWSQLWSERHCKKSVADLIEEVESVLFFIHCDTIKKPISIMELTRQQGAIGDISTASEFEMWEPDKHSATQTMVIDLLQTIAGKNKGKSAKRLAVILSAWDTAKDLECKPVDFMMDHMPLLHQYLNSGFDFPQWTVYGVSAQGGDLKTKAKELSDFKKPGERVMIVGNEDFRHDLTMPVKQLLRQG